MRHNWIKVKEFSQVYNQVKNNITLNSKGKNPELVNLFMDAFEEFFYHSLKLKYITTANVKSVLARLSRIDKVEYLMEPFRGKDSNVVKYQESKIVNKRIKVKDKTAILINPNLSKDDKVFTIFKELSGISSAYNRKLTRAVSSTYANEQNAIEDKKDFNLRYIDLGFRLIEDGINLDIAESIYASYKKAPRASRKLTKEREVFGRTVKFSSNFRRNPSFQELTTLIGRKVLKGEKDYKDNQVLYILSKYSWKEGFTKNFIIGLGKVFGEKQMFEIINKLGIIYKKEMDASDAFLAKTPSLRVKHAKKALKDIRLSLDTNEADILTDVPFNPAPSLVLLRKAS